MNKVARWLKIGAITLFCLSISGAIIASQKTELTLEKAKYSWESDKYGTTQKFDGSLFLTSHWLQQ